MVLNQMLAQKMALPVEVELQINKRPRVHLRAEHKIGWSLSSDDRARIQGWNTLLKRDSTRSVTLQKYQQLLGNRSGSR